MARIVAFTALQEELQRIVGRLFANIFGTDLRLMPVTVAVSFGIVVLNSAAFGELFIIQHIVQECQCPSSIMSDGAFEKVFAVHKSFKSRRFYSKLDLE